MLVNLMKVTQLVNHGTRVSTQISDLRVHGFNHCCTPWASQGMASLETNTADLVNCLNWFYSLFQRPILSPEFIPIASKFTSPCMWIRDARLTPRLQLPLRHTTLSWRQKPHNRGMRVSRSSKSRCILRGQGWVQETRRASGLAEEKG